ncbi:MULTISPECIES: DUF1439 domain-containing protein [unclassified Lysobacter]|uniref:DUF1439 domain-containing protein n=1 Tax=unclassified Lysobacter TaxID=2635362 RepID=UPI0006F69624|nr:MULTISPECIES: DUF1439 domain-containing protein [unclassified Lysobacter]KQZ60147.1 hypothetical protein ASD53_03040 [Lysobacter sp. Root559]KRC38588.1 hypothetical protein ASE10_03355 [Lysobacter sp. Root76]KRD71210.1 hypothetical protein ASE45_05095 [Lysobacter sp. Root96]
MPARPRFRSTLLRSLLLAAALLALAACSTLNAVSAYLGNEVAFTAPQLQQSLSRNFPKRYEKLGGLVAVTLMNPRLSIPDGGERLRLDFDIALAALGAGSSQRPSGRFTLTSALRYDATTQGLHLLDPRIDYVDVPQLGGMMTGASRELLNAWLSDYARQEPVYRFDNSLLDKLGSRRIGSTQIEHGRVVVHLDR